MKLSPFQEIAYEEAKAIPAQTKQQLAAATQSEAVALALAKDVPPLL